MKRMLAWLPWATLVTAALLLFLQYPNYPDQWIIHWNAAGQPDGWTHKSPWGAAFPLALGGGLLTVLELLAWVAGRSPNHQLPSPWPQRLAECNRSIIRGISFGFAIFFGYLALHLPHGAPSLAAPLALIAYTVVVPFWLFYSEIAGMRAEGVLPEGYHGLIYSNPKDARIWVPKICGFGATLNFAHKRSWLILAAVLALPLGMVGTAVMSQILR